MVLTRQHDDELVWLHATVARRTRKRDRARHALWSTVFRRRCVGRGKEGGGGVVSSLRHNGPLGSLCAPARHVHLHRSIQQRHPRPECGAERICDGGELRSQRSRHGRWLRRRRAGPRNGLAISGPAALPRAHLLSLRSTRDRGEIGRVGGDSGILGRAAHAALRVLKGDDGPLQGCEWGCVNGGVNGNANEVLRANGV